MNPQKERFLYFYNFYIEKGRNIATTLSVLDYLTTHTDDYSAISKAAPAFMESVWNNFVAQAIIELDGFYYDPNGLSFTKYFNYTRANWNLIFTGDFYDTIYRGKEKEIRPVRFDKKYIFGVFDQCRKLIEANKALLDKIRLYRDHIFAHYGDLSKKPLNEEITIDDLMKVLSLTETIINKIGVIYNRTIVVLKPQNADDIDNICGMVEECLKRMGEYER